MVFNEAFSDITLPTIVVAVLGIPETIIAFFEKLLFFAMNKLKSDIKERLYQESIFEVKNKINDINKHAESKNNGENPSFDFKCLSVISDILFNKFNNWNFCGFYTDLSLDHPIYGNLILPCDKFDLKFPTFRSDTMPCSSIEMHGVCGKSLKARKTIIVPDVEKFDGHIVCDSKSKSEIAITFIMPILPYVGSEILESHFVLDVDSKEYDDFDSIDENYLKKIITLLEQKDSKSLIIF